MGHQPIVGTDSRDLSAFPVLMTVAHQPPQGIIHRAVHVEILDEQGNFLVWRKANGMIEIPGGHVDWNEDLERPLTYEESMLKELTEELCLVTQWKLPPEKCHERLRRLLNPVTKQANQFSSRERIINQWVMIFRLRWPMKEWGDPCTFTLDPEEGMSSPTWLSLSEIERYGLQYPMDISASIRLLLLRGGIMIPFSHTPSGAKASR